MLEFLKAPFLVLHFSFYTLMTFLMILSVTLISMLMMLLYSKCDQASDLWQQFEFASELESDLRDTVDWGRKRLVDFNAGKTQLVLFDRSCNTAILIWKWMGLFLRKNHLLRYWAWLSLLNWIGIGIIRQATKTNMQGCWSFTCCFSWTHGTLSKCGQLKSFL